jgi:pimeloyl-ACP methyl ester carboxylesterase
VTSKCTVLFAVGAGGDPNRHLPLLNSLTQQGCLVIAPQFERLSSARPTSNELLIRTNIIRTGLSSAASTQTLELPLVGIGHSIGAALLLALAGAQMWMNEREQLDIGAPLPIAKLVLMAPAAGYFQAPGALDALSIPMQVFAGSNDLITPPDQAIKLKEQLHGKASVDLRIKEGAGHFSFMNSPPPHIPEPLSNRAVFLDEVANAILDFLELKP